MSGDHRQQQEFGEYVRGGATLVISLEGLNWFCRRRRCSDKEERKKKRDEDLQLWTSSGHMMLPDERLQCLCISEQTGSAALNLWRNTGLRTSSPPSPQNCRLTEGPEEPWISLVLNTRDVFTLITRNRHLETQQNTMTMDRPKKCIVFCSEDIPSRLFSDCRTIVEKSDSHISDNNNSTVFSTSDPNNNSVVDHRGTTHGENFNLCTHKSLPAESSGKDRMVKMRKSVSFDNDVMVYLFDQESPTMKLHSGPDVTLEDNGLEWEDDFSALEESFHVRRVSCAFSPPPSRPQRYVVSQTCLFLTHVTESDLEL
ncbi:hypothetical protein JOB18_014342 [Solea senegalensis]|uniref:Uncharacterized protein n=1 Tax=Solea senegalensis TaxID=28829 RepID=A0AAV6RQW4_SOLSE|nr:uncharacterized protein LOC122758783 isoform X2 [Solea senegalensis]KAG7506727.1 hypothetical protein JOB18_014342 [Solea senegalensis]